MKFLTEQNKIDNVLKRELIKSVILGSGWISQNYHSRLKDVYYVSPSKKYYLKLKKQVMTVYSTDRSCKVLSMKFSEVNLIKLDNKRHLKCGILLLEMNNEI